MEFIIIYLLLILVAFIAFRYTKINNWIWLIWGLITILLLIIALNNFGSPIVLHAIQEQFSPPSEVPEYKSWIWWNIWISFLIGWIILTPICFLDDLTKAYNKVKNSLASKASTVGQHINSTNKNSYDDFTRIKQFFVLVFTATFLSQLLIEFGKIILPKIFKAKR